MHTEAKALCTWLKSKIFLKKITTSVQKHRTIRENKTKKEKKQLTKYSKNKIEILLTVLDRIL